MTRSAPPSARCARSSIPGTGFPLVPTLGVGTGNRGRRESFGTGSGNRQSLGIPARYALRNRARFPSSREPVTRGRFPEPPRAVSLQVPRAEL